MEKEITQLKISICNFNDYRTFLLAYALEKRRINKNWTYGLWSRRIGLKDKSSIGKILQGHRHPGPQLVDKLIDYFHFSKHEAQYFKDLVQLRKLLNTPTFSKQIIKKLKKIDQSYRRLNIMDLDTYTLVSKWFYLALREITNLDDFSEDVKWIQKKFQFSISSQEIKKGLSLLIKLGLLERDSKGLLQSTDHQIKIGDQGRNLAIQNYHHNTLNLAKESLQIVPLSEREITSKMLVMNFKDIKEAKKFIKDFKEQFSDQFEQDRGDALYQLQIQLFPLTKIKKEIS